MGLYPESDMTSSIPSSKSPTIRQVVDSVTSVTALFWPPSCFVKCQNRCLLSMWISLTNKKHRTYLLMSKINSMSQTCTSPFIQQFRLIQPHLCDNCGWESPSLLTKRPPKAPSWGHTSQVDGTPKCPPGAGGNWCAQLSWSNTQTGSKYSNPQER
jgi:hypothetical protein